MKPPPASPAPQAIGLFSGGLDSILAARLLQEQGIRVRVLRFITPFFGWDLNARRQEEARRIRELYGLDLSVEAAWPEYLDVVRHPRFGHGKNMNPCIDCKIFMLRLAADAMRRLGAAFVFTGEVLNQRPMSQRRDTLNVIQRESGLAGRLLRPLSARCLPPTIPEQEGLVDRDRLQGISGRSRKSQMQLAAELGVSDYPAPAGGCLLTDPAYSRKLADLFRTLPATGPGDIELLSVGRHFSLGASRLVVGRNREENGLISALAAEDDLLFSAADIPGPTSLLRGSRPPGMIDLAARITARYADHGGRGVVRILVVGGPPGELTVFPADPADVERRRTG